MKLSVVILNYNVRYFLELCLKSVKAAITDIEAEIIVVDNNSSDDSCIMVKDLFPDVVLIENKENTGFSKGNNIGVAHAKGEFLCILNPDTVVAEDTFTKLLKFADSKKDLGIIGCKLIDGNGDYLPESKRNIPTPKVSFSKIFGKGNSYYANHLQVSDIGEVAVLVGAFMLLKREIFNIVGGFDEDYFMYGEDIDLSYRILNNGYKNYYVGSQTIIHFKGESTPKNKIYRKRFYEAMGIFYKKHFKRNFLLDIIVKLGTVMIPIFESRNLKKETAEKKYTILDNNNITFKDIIASIENEEGPFKIRLKNANFIIGSNGSKTRGEVDDVE